MDKEKFRKIFDKCMSINYVFCNGLDENEKIVSEKHSMSPKMIIRDLESDWCEGMALPDKEFTDFEKASEYFDSIDSPRVMDVSGTIYFDYDGLSQNDQ